MQFYISTISDNPKFIFDHLPIFEENGISGIHFDVMDGNFVPRLGLYPELLKSISESTVLPIEVHLMHSRPDDFIKILANNGAKRIQVHIETLKNPERTLGIIKEEGMESCIVLNSETDFLESNDFLHEIDSFMLMAIKPGIPKHPFIPSTLNKLTMLRAWLDIYKPDTNIGIDGGVTFSNAKKLFDLGANWLVCGSGTAFSPRATLKDNLTRLQKILVD